MTALVSGGPLTRHRKPCHNKAPSASSHANRNVNAHRQVVSSWTARTHRTRHKLPSKYSPHAQPTPTTTRTRAVSQCQTTRTTKCESQTETTTVKVPQTVLRLPTRTFATFSMSASPVFERIKCAPRDQVVNTTCGGTMPPSDAIIHAPLNVPRVSTEVKLMLNKSR